ncbi:restriction endonuclease subunit S [Salmonella enterica]|uniref:restriction endonuclease subunit S n=1 Tax=Salmonella enterica TaxID=28901 RepID=UPI0009B02745|nr:restriction endonuclease subunit S [Salmonella enterica]EBW4356788.1 restriction endonuclease subunit S [Salmonella enterica subsp. enterica serovar Kintambo]EDT0728914.1 restriction endonuclease subunit S [Salmonella enterica subsp. enterica serovar Havana]EGC4075976.1 restriction endonuclease subunit S [Salmonella enterica subsp. enterica serovar Havana]EHU5774631.1 restriction endonuclease subunit S [Salmonella enterica]
MSGGKLPEGWGKTVIGDIADVISGGTPKSGIAENFAPSGEGIAWLTPADLSGYKKKFISHGARDLSTEGYSSCSAKLMPAGAILFSSRAPIGYVAVASNEISTNQGFKSFVFTNDIYPDYAYYYLRNIRHLAEEMGTGTTFKEISGSAAKTLPFVMAPLAEQKIIAEKLDTLLAQVDNTKARLKQIPQILKRFRQAVLAAAVTGRLTKEYNDCTKKTIELENYKISIPKKWNETILNNVINTQRPLCYGVVQPGDDINDGIELIRVCDINDGEVDLNHLRRISKEIDIQYKRSKVQKNDILITIVGAIGRIGIVRENINVNIARAVARVSPESKFIIPMFLHIWLSSPIMQTWLVQSSKEVARKTLNLKDLKEAFVPLPSIEEQHEIVRRVEQLFAYADTIEKQVNNALTRVNSLTQSILAKAFRGELTAQWRAENPELISGENSAAALLEKIKAERAASGGKKNSRKKV